MKSHSRFGISFVSVVLFALGAGCSAAPAETTNALSQQIRANQDDDGNGSFDDGSGAGDTCPADGQFCAVDDGNEVECTGGIGATQVRKANIAPDDGVTTCRARYARCGTTPGCVVVQRCTGDGEREFVSRSGMTCGCHCIL